jgi:hypothetical protein
MDKRLAVAAALVLWAAPALVDAHARWVCPAPRSANTGIKVRVTRTVPRTLWPCARSSAAGPAHILPPLSLPPCARARSARAAPSRATFPAHSWT